MSQECPVSGEECRAQSLDDCFLVQEVGGHQAQRGGYQSKVEQQGSGTFWHTDAWNIYVGRVIGMVQSNCPVHLVPGIKERIKKITEEKEKREELFVDKG